MNTWYKFLFEMKTIQKTNSEYIKNFIINRETHGALPNLTAYQDSADNWTIGYGSRKMPNGEFVKPGDEITPEEATVSIEKNIQQAVSDVNQYVKVDLNNNQFDALVSLLYNMGADKFYRSSLRAMINKNPNDPNIRNEFLLYNKDSNHQEQQGLKQRREEEAQIYFTPVKQQPSIPVKVLNQSAGIVHTQTKIPVKKDKAPQKKLKESQGVTLGDLAEIRTDFPEADFWLIRVHDEKTVGKPVKEFAPNRIGIKVTATDVLDPNYLRYAMEHLWMKGFFRELATGTTNKVNIKTKDVKSIRMG